MLKWQYLEIWCNLLLSFDQTMKQFHFLKFFTMLSGRLVVCMSLFAATLCCLFIINKHPFAISSYIVSLSFLSSMTHKVCLTDGSSMFTRQCFVFIMPCSLYSRIIQSVGACIICSIGISYFVPTSQTKHSWHSIQNFSYIVLVSRQLVFPPSSRSDRTLIMMKVVLISSAPEFLILFTCVCKPPAYYFLLIAGIKTLL